MESTNMKQIRDARVQQVLDMTAKLDAKIDSLGVKKKSVFMATSDLGDLYGYAGDIKKHLEDFVSVPPSEWRTMAKILVDLRVRLGEMKDHIAHSRATINYLADYCYKKAPSDIEEIDE
jgi:hypothetical protein